MIVVMSMAGRGSRFAGHGVARPKPLIPVAGKPMFAWALRSLDGLAYRRIVFVVLAEQEAHFDVTSLVRRYAGDRAEVVLLDEVTQGQLCSVLAARDYFDSDEDVLVASSDTYVRSNLARDIARCRPACHGLISVADLPGDRWSFARTDESGAVVEVAEKVRISDHASTGMYYFANGRRFVETAEAMIANEEKTRGEYYVIPVYQKYIDQGLRVELSVAQAMWDMGTPGALAAFERHLADQAPERSPFEA